MQKTLMGWAKTGSPLANIQAQDRPFEQDMGPGLAALLGFGRGAGADLVEIFLERRRSSSILIEQQKVASIAPTSYMAAGLRVFTKDRDAYCSTQDLSWQGLAKALDQALLMLGLESHKRRWVDVSLPPLLDYAKHGGKNDYLSSQPTNKEACERLLDLNRLVYTKADHVSVATTTYSTDAQEVLVAASDGTFARDIRWNQTAGQRLLCVDKQHRTEVSDRKGQTGHNPFLAQLDIEDIADRLKESAGRMLRADYVQAGEKPVVIGNGFGGVLFHEACGHLVETTSMLRKSTPFADKFDQPIAHSAVTAWDEGLGENDFGSVAMDDEGMPSQRTLLIEEGRLRNFLSDRKGERICKQARTGSGRRQNAQFAPTSRMRNTFIAPGPHTPEEVIASVEDGLYCSKMGGGSVGPGGEFNFSVAEAWEIKGGKLTRPLKGATLVGSATDIMQRISMCANDMTLAPGFCGSMSGSVYVTVGQPHLKVDSISVGGRH